MAKFKVQVHFEPKHHSGLVFADVEKMFEDTGWVITPGEYNEESTDATTYMVAINRESLYEPVWAELVYEIGIDPYHFEWDECEMCGGFVTATIRV